MNNIHIKKGFRIFIPNSFTPNNDDWMADASQKDYYEHRVKNMPVPVLLKHNVI